jgi:hypothetical protein
MTPTAHIEPLAGVIRVFDCGRSYGDPYRYAVTVRWLDRQTVELVGALRAPAPSEWRAIRDALVAAGVARVVMIRKGGANPRVAVLTA